MRVIEVVDPASGQRYRQAVYDLTKTEIQTVQRALRGAGYLGVGWTGQMDHGTVKALHKLQEDRGLYPCGCVSYETIISLGLRPAVEVTAVAVGGSSGAAHVAHAGSCFGCRAGLYYPVPIPVWVPVDPADGGEGEDGEGNGKDPGDSPPISPPAGEVSGALTPGLRPAPPARFGPPPTGIAPPGRPAPPATRVAP